MVPKSVFVISLAMSTSKPSSSSFRQFMEPKGGESVVIPTRRYPRSRIAAIAEPGGICPGAGIGLAGSTLARTGWPSAQVPGATVRMGVGVVLEGEGAVMAPGTADGCDVPLESGFASGGRGLPVVAQPVIATVMPRRTAATQRHAAPRRRRIRAFMAGTPCTAAKDRPG